MARILVIHGAGMNMRGKIQRDVFGPMTLPEYDKQIRAYGAALGIDIDIFHSNLEGEVINRIYEAADLNCDGALINPAGFMIGYPALAAAISQVPFPTIEVHISNVHKREEFRHKSFVSLRADGVIAGCGTQGYQFGLRRVAALIEAKKA